MDVYQDSVEDIIECFASLQHRGTLTSTDATRVVQEVEKACHRIRNFLKENSKDVSGCDAVACDILHRVGSLCLHQCTSGFEARGEVRHVEECFKCLNLLYNVGEEIAKSIASCHTMKECAVFLLRLYLDFIDKTKDRCQRRTMVDFLINALMDVISCMSSFEVRNNGGNLPDCWHEIMMQAHLTIGKESENEVG
jgi:hypothetical protein